MRGAPAEVARRARRSAGRPSVGARGQADQDLVGQDEDVAAVDEALVHLGDMGEMATQGRRERGGLGEPAGRAGAEQDRPFGQDEGRILDEDRIGMVGERRERLHRDSGRLERGDIGAVLGEDAVVARRLGRCAGRGRRSARLADDGAVEIEDPHRHSVQISTLPNRTTAAISISDALLASLRLISRYSAAGAARSGEDGDREGGDGDPVMRRLCHPDGRKQGLAFTNG